MFDPWCPTCSARILLGTRRIESVDQGPSGTRVVLRCFCDTLLVWSPASERAGGRAAEQRGRPGSDQSTGDDVPSTSTSVASGAGASGVSGPTARAGR